MQRISKLIVMTLVLAFAVITTSACAHPPKKKIYAEKIRQEVFEKLELTDAQKPKVEKILKDARKMRQAVFKGINADGDITKKERRVARDEMKKIDKKTRKKLEFVLTVKQMKKFDKIVAEFRKKVRKHSKM